MKPYQILPLFFIHLAFAQPVTPEDLDSIKQSVVGKKITNYCDNLKKQEICQAHIKTLRNNIRIIYPNMPITMDYSPQRINIKVDINSVIKEVTIG